MEPMRATDTNTRYERPDQPWLCGRTGNPCRRGPGTHGNLRRWSRLYAGTGRRSLDLHPPRHCRRSLRGRSDT